MTKPSKAVKQFKGLSQYKSAATVPMDEALDLMNVITNPSGELQKFRLPVQLANIPGQTGNGGMWDYQRADGVRQLIVTLGTQIWRYDQDYVGTLIDDNALNAFEWSCVEANNILFMANGMRMLKWTGDDLWNWGIAKPPTTPIQGATFPIINIIRSGGIVTVTIADIQNVYKNISGGIDLFTVSGVTDASFNGTFLASAGGSQAVYAQAGANVTSSGGFLTLGSAITGKFTVTKAVRKNNVATITASITPALLASLTQPGISFTLSTMSSTTYNGTFTIDSISGSDISFTQFAADLPLATVTGFINLGSFNGPNQRFYRYAYKNSVTGHVSTASDPTLAASIFTDVPGFTRAYYVQAPTPAFALDPQIDTIVWYATLQGGGDYFKHSEAPIADTILVDLKDDSTLDTTERAPLINDPPPVGRYVSKWQGRIFVSGLTADLGGIPPPAPGGPPSGGGA